MTPELPVKPWKLCKSMFAGEKQGDGCFWTMGGTTIETFIA